MKCIEVSNVNYEQFERLARRYEMSKPQLMGSIINFFKHLPISPIEINLVYSMIRFFNETGINPLEPGEDLSLVLMKRVLAELKEVSASIVYQNGYAGNRQEYKMEALELQTKAIKLAVENITYLIRLQDRAAAQAAPQLDAQQLVRDLLTAFSGSKSVSVLVSDDPMNTLTSRAVELTRSHLQAAHALYKQELPSKRGLRSWFSWFSKRNEAIEREHIMELARQLHENEAKQILAGRVSGAFIELPVDVQEENIPDDTLWKVFNKLDEIIDEEDEFFLSHPVNLAVDNDDGGQGLIVAERLLDEHWAGLPKTIEREEPKQVWDLPEEDSSTDSAALVTVAEFTKNLAMNKSDTDSQPGDV